MTEQQTDPLADAVRAAIGETTDPEALNGTGPERRAGGDGGPDGLERAARAALGLGDDTNDGSTRA